MNMKKKRNVVVDSVKKKNVVADSAKKKNVEEEWTHIVVHQEVALAVQVSEVTVVWAEAQEAMEAEENFNHIKFLH